MRTTERRDVKQMPRKGKLLRGDFCGDSVEKKTLDHVCGKIMDGSK